MDILPPEIIVIISGLLSTVSCLRNFRDTNKYFHSLLTLKRCRNDNDIAILVQLYPKANWDRYIACLPAISKKIVDLCPDVNWDLELLYQNPNIDPYTLPKWKPPQNNLKCYHPHSFNRNPNLQFVEEHFHDYKWHCERAVSSKHFNADTIPKYPNIAKFIAKYICYNPNYKLKDLIELGIPINLTQYSENPNLTLEEVLTPLPEHITIVRPWCLHRLSKHLKFDDITKYFHLWEYPQLSMNPSITWNYVVQNKHKNWEWPLVSGTFKVKWAEIDKIITFDYNHEDNLYSICMYAYGALEFVIEHPEIDWNTEGLLYNPFISFDDVMAHKYLFQSIWHRDIRWDVVKSRPDINWSFKVIDI